MSVSIGFDTEAFLSAKGSIVPMGGLIPGTKKNPHRITAGMDYFIQEDGVTVETNTPVSNDPIEAYNLLRNTWNRASLWLSRYINSPAGRKFAEENGRTPIVAPDISVQMYTAWDFPHASLVDAGPGSFVFGCEPDFNAYAFNPEATSEHPLFAGCVPNKAPSAQQLGGLRFAGGHVHFGYNTDIIPRHIAVQLCDIAARICNIQDEGPRKQWYGKAGCYRPKSYGIEYRSLGTHALNSELGQSFLRTMHAVLGVEKQYALQLYRALYPTVVAIGNGEAIDRKAVRATWGNILPCF